MLCDRHDTLFRIVPWRALFKEHGNGEENRTDCSTEKESRPQIM
ncbi:hypothetical protein RRSWK_07237 [Rhodopirellula sp. SWK7]|nr:hypothetical protein RRSWK_07237 [Rhodopirellula sp. SWK7]